MTLVANIQWRSVQLTASSRGQRVAGDVREGVDGLEEAVDAEHGAEDTQNADRPRERLCLDSHVCATNRSKLQTYSTAIERPPKNKSWWLSELRLLRPTPSLPCAGLVRLVAVGHEVREGDLPVRPLRPLPIPLGAAPQGCGLQALFWRGHCVASNFEWGHSSLQDVGKMLLMRCAPC